MAEKTLTGVAISLAASALDAIGLNTMRRDHVQNFRLPEEQRRPEFKRGLWVLGLVLYVASQLFGSTAALYFLQPAVVAPLGAASLVFNFLFAFLLVGYTIKVQDIVGTASIITGAILVAIFGDVPKQQQSLDTLLALYNRAAFIIYFSVEETIVVIVLVFAIYTRRLLTGQQLRQRSILFKNASDKKIKKTGAVSFATAGGLIASQTVLLAETGVQLISASVEKGNQFTSFQPFLIVFILLVTAFAQVYCMNAGLKLASAVTVAPVFFAFYSVLAFLNGNIYHDTWDVYSPLQYSMILLGIFILVFGVRAISISQEMQQQQADTANNQRLPDNTMVQVNQLPEAIAIPLESPDDECTAETAKEEKAISLEDINPNVLLKHETI